MIKPEEIRNMTDDQLQAKMREIELRNGHWRSCRDGSYECALANDGWTACRDELKRRESHDDQN